MKLLNKKEFIKDLKKIFFENLNIKIICLLLAIAAYLLIGVFQKNERSYNCKLSIVGLKDYLSIENELPENVKVIAKDKQKILDKITDEEFKIRIDLSNIETPDNYNVNVQWALPKSMRSFFSMVEIIPNKISVKVDKLVEKNIPVVVNYFGNLEENLILKKTVVNPTEVRIQGPERLINKLKFVETEKINIQGEEQSFYRDISLNIPYKNIKIIGKNRVEVYFDITKDMDTITLKFDNIYYNNLKDDFKLIYDKTTIHIKVSGSKNILQNLSKDNVVIMVDCQDIDREGIYYLNIEVILPKGVESISISPQIIKVDAELKKN